MTIREQTEQLEKNTLSKYAALSSQTAGRDFPHEKCPLRTEFQRDRDRILHSRSFRRLMNKTQVFLLPDGDHYRTRLTHTLEVSQIARTAARALNLNEDLTEAIALGHDLGHTPFGHAGEDVLQKVCPHGFLHNVQSVRVVERLENCGKGLNLTKEVRNGILCHSHAAGQIATTFEGQIVRFADKIAYMNHDIDDAVRANVMSESDVPWNVRLGLGVTKSERITSLVKNLVENSVDSIRFDTGHQALYDELRSFMFEAVYTNPVAKREESKAMQMVEQLYFYFVKNVNALPQEFKDIAEKEGTDRAVCDYISGMSDRFCMLTYKNLFLPQAWAL